MAHTIRVSILKREFALVVEEEDEELTHELAAFVDKRIHDFRRAHPEQPEVTAAVIAAMSIAEELYTERDERARMEGDVESELDGMAARLSEALDGILTKNAPGS